MVTITGRPLKDKLNWIQAPHEDKDKEKSPESTPENRNTGKLPVGKREERRKNSSFQSKVKSPIHSANWFSQQDANWMQDPRSTHCKGELPFQKVNKENPLLRRDTEGR